LRRSANLLRALDAPVTYRVLTLVIIGAIWQLYAIADRGLLIPTFTGAVTATGQILADGDFWRAFLLSNQSLVLGFGIALVLGIPLGLFMGRFRPAERFVNVYLNILIVTPMAAIIPLLLMSFGFGLASRVVLVVLMTCPYLIIHCRAGVRQVDPGLIEMARSFGASELALWRRILLRASMPAVMSGIRIGLGRAVTAMVIAELLMVAVGFGKLMSEYRTTFQAEELYGLVIIMVAEALVLISVARWLERVLVPWGGRSALAR